MREEHPVTMMMWQHRKVSKSVRWNPQAHVVMRENKWIEIWSSTPPPVCLATKRKENDEPTNDKILYSPMPWLTMFVVYDWDNKKKLYFRFCDFDPFVLHVRVCEVSEEWVLGSVDVQASHVRLYEQKWKTTRNFKQ